MTDIILPNNPGNQDNTSIEFADVYSNDTATRDVVNGNLDNANLSGAAEITAANLATAVQEAGGFNATSVRRGKSIIATEEARSNVAYGLLTTPDRVSSVVLPTDGLITVGYMALVQQSVGGAASIAIFVGANQLKIATAGAPVVQETGIGGSSALYRTVGSFAGGLESPGAGSPASHVTTGQVVGAFEASSGVCTIFAAAGAYDISVQFKASTGSVTAKERKLWVEARGYS